MEGIPIVGAQAERFADLRCLGDGGGSHSEPFEVFEKRRVPRWVARRNQNANALQFLMGKVIHTRNIRSREGQRKRKGRAGPDLAFDDDFSTDQLDQRLGNGEPETGSPVSARGRRVCLTEGVETQEQADLLVSQGCDELQGYLFSRPCPVDEFEGLPIKEKTPPES